MAQKLNILTGIRTISSAYGAEVRDFRQMDKPSYGDPGGLWGGARRIGCLHKAAEGATQA
jgi:hypothetical protein